jgi:hypothetical protein
LTSSARELYYNLEQLRMNLMHIEKYGISSWMDKLLYITPEPSSIAEHKKMNNIWDRTLIGTPDSTCALEVYSWLEILYSGCWKMQYGRVESWCLRIQKYVYKTHMWKKKDYVLEGSISIDKLSKTTKKTKIGTGLELAVPTKYQPTTTHESTPLEVCSRKYLSRRKK